MHVVSELIFLAKIVGLFQTLQTQMFSYVCFFCVLKSSRFFDFRGTKRVVNTMSRCNLGTPSGALCCESAIREFLFEEYFSDRNWRLLYCFCSAYQKLLVHSSTKIFYHTQYQELSGLLPLSQRLKVLTYACRILFLLIPSLQKVARVKGRRTIQCYFR